jgi:hypothetical protein
MLVVCIAGNYLNYKGHSNIECKNPEMMKLLGNSEMMKLFGNVLLVQYLRLIQVIMIALLILICCPLILFCNLFRRSGPAAAPNVI